MIGRLISWVMPYAWPIAAAAGLALVGAVGVQAYQIRGLKLEAAQLIIKAKKEADKRGLEVATEQGRIVDALLEKNSATALERDAVSERLRKLTANRSQLAATCAGSNEAAGSIIPDQTRSDLVAEAKRANEIVHQLTAAQGDILALRKACSP